jgi:hypothetical protein
MYPDFKELLSVLNAYSVKYLVVGAYAVSIHAQSRATKDIDIWVKPDVENAKAIYTALRKFGAPLKRADDCRLRGMRPVFSYGPGAGCGGHPNRDPRR